MLLYDFYFLKSIDNYNLYYKITDINHYLK
jgi:hypothetical protein